MSYNVLKEDPPNTGVYVEIGEVLEGGAAEIISQIVLRTQESGSRYAVFPNEPLNMRAASPETQEVE